MRARRLGEIRLGDTVTRNGKTYPVSLDTFRLTSIAKGLLDQAAVLYGGEVVPWQPKEKGASKWQLVTNVSELPVYVAPQDPESVTFYELWSAGGLQRRCDGETMLHKPGNLPCVCDPKRRECHMMTRLQVMLPELPDVGVWMLSSTGYYAASEMAASIQIVMSAAQTTGLLPEATLAIEKREAKRPGEPTKKFSVPVLRFSDTLSTFMGSGSVALPAPESPVAPLPAPRAQQEEEVDVPSSVPQPPPPAPPTVINVDPDGDIEQQLVDGGIEAFVEEVVENTDDGWPQLLALLEETPGEGTMDEVRDRVYRLFRFMHKVGLWGEPESSRLMALHAHHDVDHLSDLRKSSLNTFAAMSFDAARAKIGEERC